MDEAVFRAYIAEFNAANFDALARYYADDVVFSFNGGLTLTGRDAIVGFYRPFRAAVDETVDIRFLVMDDKHVAVEMATEFRARADYQNFTRGPLKAGDTVRITSFVHYDIGPDGRFTSIRVGRYGDWKSTRKVKTRGQNGAAVPALSRPGRIARSHCRPC